MITPGMKDDYEMSQSEIAEKLFLRQQTICKIEQRAIKNFKEILESKGYTLDDLLNY